MALEKRFSPIPIIRAALIAGTVLGCQFDGSSLEPIPLIGHDVGSEVGDIIGVDATDGGSPDADTGVDPEDGGSPDVDTGVDPEDGGSPDADTGVDPEDGGSPDADTGVDPEDGGSPDADTGVDPEDGGISDTDTGVDPTVQIEVTGMSDFIQNGASTTISLVDLTLSRAVHGIAKVCYIGENIAGTIGTVSIGINNIGLSASGCATFPDLQLTEGENTLEINMYVKPITEGNESQPFPNVDAILTLNLSTTDGHYTIPTIREQLSSIQISPIALSRISEETRIGAVAVEDTLRINGVPIVGFRLENSDLENRTTEGIVTPRVDRVIFHGIESNLNMWDTAFSLFNEGENGYVNGTLDDSRDVTFSFLPEGTNFIDSIGMILAVSITELGVAGTNYVSAESIEIFIQSTIGSDSFREDSEVSYLYDGFSVTD